MISTESPSVKLHPSWLAALEDEFSQPYMQSLRDFLKQESEAGQPLYPPSRLIFNALDSTPLDQVRVVILGQDPYHGPGQAHGLCFSVPRGVRQPPSLLNIFKAIQNDLGIPPSSHGCLEDWCEQGVLLLNAVLTVRHKQAGSHAGKGWEVFTDKVIQVLNEHCDGLVFLLWGAYAQKKGTIIDANRHLVLKAVHPSPLSAHRGFLDCQHFSKANDYLQSRGKDAINWALSE